MPNHKVKLKDRREFDNGLVKYRVVVLYDHDEDGDMETIFDDDYGVSKRQEEMDRFDDMIADFARQRIEEYENNRGVDHSSKEMTL